MDRRLTNLLISGLIVLATVWVTIMFYGLGWEGFCGPARGMCEMGGCEVCNPAWPGALAGIAAWVGGAVVLVGGLWSAWRVGTGHWGLRRRPDSSPALPAV